MIDHQGNVITSKKPTYLISDVVSSIDEPNLFSNDLLIRCRESNISEVPKVSISGINCIMEDGVYQCSNQSPEEIINRIS